IGQIIMDNAGNCNTAMEKIQRCCAADDICFDADGNHCRTNYLVQYEDALCADPVGKTCSTVRALRSSGQQRSELREIIMDGNKAGCWIPSIRPVQLLRDVDTRWSSLFGMVGRAIELYPVSFCIIMKTCLFTLFFIRHLILHLFTEDEFQVVHDIHSILEMLHSTQELLSAEKTPTLSMALPAFEMLVISWLNIQKIIPELGHYIGVSIAKIQEYTRKGRQSCIYALAMILNPSQKMNWINEHWSQKEASDAKVWMLQAVRYCFTSFIV
ncbi:hypothetical protein CPB84DRAFT_1678641, partial [Gymnopilus junonius]